MSEPQLEIRPYRPGDEVKILETFNLVFREVCGPSFVDRTMEQWRWQYQDNPVGNRIFVALAKDGTVVSHYAGVPMQADTDHGPQIFVHCVDSMTHPEWRQGLARPGVFVLTCLPWSADCRKRGDALMFGFPVKAAERVGRRYLDYHFLRVVDFLIRDVTAGPLPMPLGLEARRVDALPAEVDALYQRMLADKHCLVRRDHRYLAWRYRQIPSRDDYQLWTIRGQGELRALLVLRPRHELAPDSCTIADWVAAAGDIEARDAMLHVATRRAREEGRQRVLAVFPEDSVEGRALRERGFALVPSGNWLERRLTYSITASPMTEDFLREHWWYTFGDSDLV